MTHPKQSEFTKGWKSLFSGMIGVSTGTSPLPFNTLPIVIGPINYAMGWSFQEISIGITIYGIMGCIFAPAVGGLADKIGTKRVALTSLLLFGFAFGSMAFVPGELYAFYLFWAIIGMVGIGSSPVTWSRTINLWFYEHRGLALGILLVGTSIAGFIVPQIANAVLEMSDWRTVFLVLAALPLFVGFPIALLMFRDPDPDERPVENTAVLGDLPGMTLREAVTGYKFWVMFVSIACIALAYGGAHIHMVQMVMPHGFTSGSAATIMGVVAIGILSGRVIVGLLFDKFWAPGVAAPVLAMPVIACYFLIGSDTQTWLVFVAGYLMGFAAGAESDMIAYMASRYFGVKNYGKIYGFLFLPFGIFSSLSATMYGTVRDTTGNYDLVLTWAMGLFAFGGLILLVLGRYPQWDQKGVQPQHET